MLAVVLLCSCNSSKYLLEEQSFLEDNSVKLKSEYKIKNKGLLKESLEDQFRQVETRTFMGVPRHSFYYKGLDNPDSTWFKRWLNTKLGDPPVLFDTASADLTVDAMVRLLHQKGYWDAVVEYDYATEGHRTSVVYNVDPKERWTVGKIDFVSPDTSVQLILDSIKNETNLPPGGPVDSEAYEAERQRITRAMQDLGYAEFYRSYVGNPLADSADLKMNLELPVLNPPQGRKHRIYDIGEIRVYPDFTNEEPIEVDTMIDGIRFFSPTYPFLVKPQAILRSIYFQTGDRYHFSDIDKTRKQLNKLATYSFVAIKPSVNPLDSNVLDYDITLSRNKRMGIGGDVEFNYSTLSLTRQSLLGVGFDLNYRHRNIFKGAEAFSSSLETGVEFNFRTPDTLINSFNINLQNNFLIPRFIDPLKFYTGLNKIRIGKNGLLSDKLFSWIREDYSRINFGYQYLRLVRFYDYHTANISIGYDAQPDPTRRLQLNHFGVDFFSPTVKPQFEAILEDNPYLRESFTNQFFTGVLFKDYQFVYSGLPNATGFSKTFIQTTEISGLEVLGINGLTNALTGHEGRFEFGNPEDPITFAQFMKIDLDGRFTKKLKGSQELAFRAAAGVAFPYGPFTERVPYVKQFYIGGPQSVRAWQIRELGPGSYEDPNVPEDAVQFYQTGDVRFEISLEYRYKIAWIVNGAFFLDAGNVWTIAQDPQRPGASISTSFWKEFAVGSGVGLRLDFKYFIIRWDLGYKLRNPFPDETGNHWLWNNFNDFSFRQFNSNFAIGYPF